MTLLETPRFSCDEDHIRISGLTGVEKAGSFADDRLAGMGLS